jgi:hypothetical protein
MTNPFVATVASLDSFRDRSAVQGCAYALAGSIVTRALTAAKKVDDDDDSREVLSSSVALTAEPEVTVLATSLHRACDAADYNRAVALFLACDASLRLTADDIRKHAGTLSAASTITEKESGELADGVTAVIRADFSARVEAIVQRLREATLPPALQTMVQSVLKQWRKQRMLTAEALEKVKGRNNVEGEAAAVGPAAAADTVVDVDASPSDGVTAAASQQRGLSTYSKHTVRAVTALMKEVIEVLSVLPPAVGAPLWALMPGGDGRLDPLSDGAALATLRQVLNEAKAAQATAKAAMEGSRKKHRTEDPGLHTGAQSGVALVITRTPTAPNRLETDIRRQPEVPYAREAPKRRADPKPSPYSFGHLRAQTAPARRNWGVTEDVWAAEKDLGASAKCVSLAPAVAGNPWLVVLS